MHVSEVLMKAESKAVVSESTNFRQQMATAPEISPTRCTWSTSKAASMASSKRALLAKAATSKASAWGARTTSKAAAIAQTLEP